MAQGRHPSAVEFDRSGSRSFAPEQAAIFGRRKARPFVTFTVGSGEHSYAVHPALWLGGAAVAATLALGGIVSAAYVAFHDQILTYAIYQPIRMEQAYEDRIAALRSEIDRINSRQLIDQDAFETKIDQLMARQGELRGAQTRVLGLLAKAQDQNLKLGPDSSFVGVHADPAPTDPATSSFTSPPAVAEPTDRPQPRPLDGTPLRASWLQQILPSGVSVRSSDRSPQRRLADVETELARMKAEETRSLASVAGLAETHSATIERIVGRLGLRMAEVPTTTVPLPPKQRPRQASAHPGQPISAEDGIGGPLEPIVDEGLMMQRAEAALDRLQRIRKSAGFVPLGEPISGPIEVTSPFGERPDPFLGVLAMHTGLDLRAHTGDAVEATAAGIVTKAEREGSYGNLVEIDHGNGLQTRYGHLSGFAVTAGQKVKIGQTVGYVGSTGRSTGSHLHYETRVGGVAVNPESYLAAGNQLRSLLN
jgi:murein DD-endopeptidase MepM/ murein hydrolase activator NlpD